MFGKTKKFHFIGIGGIGMSGIAEILLNMGYHISGSDLHNGEIVKRLSNKGANIRIGHSATNILDQDVVITSTAIIGSNPELVEANKRGMPVIHRSEMLAELVGMKIGIGVAGTHGKTTVSSIIAHLLTETGLNPTSVIGGQVFNFGSNAKAGRGKYLVFEADESDGTFLKFFPFIGVITNIDADHMDHYRSFHHLKESFLTYANQVPFYGKALLCYEDPTVREILPKIKKPYMTYGFSENADLRGEIKELKGDYSSFTCFYKGDELGQTKIKLLGKHNVLNALAAIGVALELDINLEDALKSLETFQGVGRRMEHIAEVRGIDIYDDYGHHPTEVKATLEALSKKGRRILTIFQPHRYSRTQDLYKDFGSAFADSYELFLLEIYPAGEEPIKGVSSRLILDAVKEYGKPDNVSLFEKWEDLLREVTNRAASGDLILTLGAGDVTRLSKEIAANLIDSKK